MSLTKPVDQIIGENRNGLLAARPEWVRVRLDELASIQNGFAFPSFRFSKQEGKPLLRIRDVVPGRTETYYIGDYEDRYIVRQGDIVIGMDGDFNLGVWPGPEALLNQRVCKVSPFERGYSARFLRYILPGYLSAINDHTSSITVKHLSSRTLETLPIPVPPTPVQERVSDEIEKQFTRLDSGVAALERAQANLKRYRASVLKAACEGRLVPTEHELAQQENRNYETGEQLLAQVVKTRYESWNGRGINKESASPDTSDLPNLPKGWGLASIDQLSRHITSGSRDWSKYYGKGTGVFILAQNVRPMFLDLSVQQLVDAPKDTAEASRTRAQQDDILVTIVGANTGDVCRVSTELHDHYVCQSVALLRPVLPSYAKFVEIYLASHENGQAQWDRYMYGQGRPHLSFVQLRMTAVLLPPLAEQERIVAEVERRLSVIDELEATVTNNLRRAIRLRQAILKQAFSGGESTK